MSSANSAATSRRWLRDIQATASDLVATSGTTAAGVTGDRWDTGSSVIEQLAGTWPLCGSGPGLTITWLRVSQPGA
jgi:hypothetical protein